MELIRLEQTGFRYPTGRQAVLQNVNLQIQSGEFIVLCGASGCGKTTLLRHLKTAIAPHGAFEGRVLFHGTPLEEVDLRTQAGQIGFVSQNPEDQIVTDKVWHELAFGLESLGVANSVIRKRVAEMSHFFGIQEWFHQEISSLSGGQKQLLNLASVMVMQPELLLLDEPTSQLDPIAATEFISILGRIHRELGTTIFLTEHRLEEVLPYCSRLMIMEQGTIRLDGTPREVAEELKAKKMGLFDAMPAPMRIWNGVETVAKDCPMTVQEGREWFDRYCKTHEVVPIPEETGRRSQHEDNRQECVIELKDIWFRYEKNGRDILQGVSLRAYSGEVLAVLGGNGSGKTTMLSMIDGGQRPQRGKVRFPSGQRDGLISLPQNPQLLFVEDTVQKELEDIPEQGRGLLKKDKNAQDRLSNMIKLCKLESLLDRHPYDLSGGEQQRLALAKVLLAQPKILLLDEPTKGLDVEYKKIFAGILKELTGQGVAVIMVSHDIEFCAEYADCCMLMFDGQVAAEDTPRHFFSENHFYTTNTNRMVRQQLPLAVTVEDVILACGGCKSESEQGQDHESGEMQNVENQETLTVCSNRNTTNDEDRQAIVTENKRKFFHMPMRILVGIFVILLAVPFTIYAGIHFLNDEKYLFISLLIILECMLPFFLAFEGKKPPARDVVILSVLCAIGVAGRAVFAPVPQFKPVTAMTIIAGAAFGGEAGFLVGAVTILVSNMLFGQGPWTPWQMFAMGLIGLIAGILFHRSKQTKGNTKRNISESWFFLFILCCYGFLAAIVIYGGIMNPAAAIMAGIPMNWQVIGAYCLSGLPFDLAHGVATVLFLVLGARPMLRKLERVKIKFG